MIPEDSSSKINKNNGLINKFKKKDKKKNNKNIKINCTQIKHMNSTE
jgi:hypothetical protein